MPSSYIKLTGKVDRRSPRNEGKKENPIERQNLLSRDGHLKVVPGTEKLTTTELSDIPRWLARYYSDEQDIVQPKTFCYTEDGKIHLIDMYSGEATEVADNLNLKAYPKSWTFKVGFQTHMFLADGTTLWYHDGNNGNTWNDVDLTEFLPIDGLEHKDRNVLLSEKSILISKNLDPFEFNDPQDSIQIVVGSGQGRNLALSKIEDFLFILNTEGIFILRGDTISALASSFSVDLVEQRNVVATRNVFRVEQQIIFLATQDKRIELWSFDGTTSKMLSYAEKLDDFIGKEYGQLEQSVAHYYDNYYMLSFVERGASGNKLEIFYDTFEDKIDFVKGRNVSCYCSSDPTREKPFLITGRSDSKHIMWADMYEWTDGPGKFDDDPIEIKLRSRDVAVSKGQNVRFTAFRPEIEPTGNSNIFFRYLLDGRLSDYTTEQTTNLCLNGGFETWTNGATVDPDNWTSFYTTTQRSTDHLYDSYAAECVSTSPSGGLIQTISGNYYGRKVKVTAYIKTNIADKARIAIGYTLDGVTTPIQYSDYHSGNGQWKMFEASAEISTENDGIYVYLITGSNNTVLFDEVIITSIQTADWLQNLQGEHKSLGFININNQGQFIDRVRPKIFYSKGESVAFEIYANNVNQKFKMLGMGIDYVRRPMKKGKKIGA